MWEPFLGLVPTARSSRSTRRERAARSARGARSAWAASPRWSTSLLDELGLGAVDVLGYSFGGGLAQELARRAPERVRRLILCATAPGLGGVPPWPYPALLLASPARYYHPWAFRFEVPRIAGGRTRREPALLERQASARLGHPPDPLGYAFQLYAVCGLEQPAVAAPGRPADADPRRRRGPDRAARQRAPHGAAHARRAPARREGAATSSCSTNPRPSPTTSASSSPDEPICLVLGLALAANVPEVARSRHAERDRP